MVNFAGVFAGPFALPSALANQTTIQVADFTGDTLPDIFIGNSANLAGPTSNSLMVNTTPAGAVIPTFLDLSVPNIPDGSPGTMPQPTMEAAVLDLDEDGDLDIVTVSGDLFGPYAAPVLNQLYINDGTGVFSDGAALYTQLGFPTASLNGWAVQPIAWHGTAGSLYSATSPTHFVTTDLGLFGVPPAAGMGLDLVPYVR